jgi:cell division protein FtsA
MFDPSSIIVGLEVGTSKICAVVGDVSTSGALNIIGVGQARSRGVRKGEIVDVALAVRGHPQRHRRGEQMAGRRRFAASISASAAATFAGFNNRGVHPIVSAGPRDHAAGCRGRDQERESDQSSGRELRAARDPASISSSMGSRASLIQSACSARALRWICTVRPREFQSPAKSDSRGEGTATRSRSIVFNGLASALALLTPEQKELGALVIDIGGGTTEYVVYGGGIIKHTGVLAIGGDHVSNDLAYGLKVPLGRAEQLKIEHGGAFAEDSIKGRSVTLPNEHGFPERTMNLEHLRRIMSLRLEEMFQLIEQELNAKGLLDYLRCGVLLCGGGANIPAFTSFPKTCCNCRPRSGARIPSAD